MKTWIGLGCALLLSLNIKAQGYVDQEKEIILAESQSGPVDEIKKVEWHAYKFSDNIKNDNKGAWTEFLAMIDSLPGEQRQERRLIVEMANRITGENFKIGSTLLIPSSFPTDFRAYAPYPFHYEVAKKMPKLFIVDKYTQTFAAYENGELVHWGIVSTGHNDDLTPPGRYNFNWKTEYKQSSEAPEGQVWEMYWVFNFNSRNGIHVHQYALPIGVPASHGCVRMSVADAKWNYAWANGWVQQNGKLVRNGTPLIIINDNPVSGHAMHWQNSDGIISSAVQLPSDLMDIPAGTEEQRIVAWQSGW